MLFASSASNDCECTNSNLAHKPGTRDGLGGLRVPAPKGALALHLTGPLGKGRCETVFDSDAGVLSEAKPVAPTRASSQRPGLWKPLAPHALHAGLRLHPVGRL